MLAVAYEEPLHMKLSFALVPSKRGGGWWVNGSRAAVQSSLH